jgi:hypothetical protein
MMLLLALAAFDPDPAADATVHPVDDPVQFLPLLADPQLRVRLRAARALQSHPDLLLKAFRLPSPLARLHACRAAGASRSPALLPALYDRLRDPDPAVRAETALALRGFPHAPTLERLEAVIREADGLVRAQALDSLAALDPDRARPALPAAARDAASPARQVAAELAGRLVPALLPALLADRDWRVRDAALANLPSTADAVGWLIERLDREEGRLFHAVLAALCERTGRDLGPEPRPWRDWWAAARPSFRPAGAAGVDAAPATRAAFFDLPIDSTRLVFLLDLSGSMRDPAPGGAGTKLDAARHGMFETLNVLPSAARFGILGLGSDEDGVYLDPARKIWGGRLALHPAAPEVKADAERFLGGLEARGWTNLFDGIDWAMQTPDVDSIYLYSDGGASKGSVVAAAEILEELRRRNRFRRIRIHTVEVPGERNPEDNRRLLREIARATGGRSRTAGR